MNIVANPDTTLVYAAGSFIGPIPLIQLGNLPGRQAATDSHRETEVLAGDPKGQTSRKYGMSGYFQALEIVRLPQKSPSYSTNKAMTIR